VLTDAERPVAPAVIDQAVAFIRADFLQTVGIRLDFGPSREARIDDGWPIDVAIAMLRACPETDELRLLFSDRGKRVPAADDPECGVKRGEAELAGQTHPYFGTIVLYSVSERWKARDRAGLPLLFGTLRHELGHAFGLEHSDDRASFMFRCGGTERGGWTPELKREIRRRASTRWWPRR
jgi:hypothetical protein